MAQNITLMGASYSDVPAVQLPKTGGGTAQFVDTSDADATAADITAGKTAYVNGEKLTGTNTGGGGQVVITDEPDTNGGIIKNITVVPVEYQTKTATPSNQTQIISADSGKTLSSVTVNPIPSEYIIPSGNKEITSNGTGIDVSSFSTVSVNVSGSSEKNVQIYRGYATTSQTDYTATAVTLTVKKTGTYNVSWMGFRNTTSGTSGSHLYKNGSYVGTANTSFINSYGQYTSLTNQSFQKDDVLTVYARARTTNYVMGVGNLIIEEV